MKSVNDRSTGNDIVALAETDPDRTSRYRFYSRIVSPEEFSLYDELKAGGLSFPVFVWLLWSIKESAYKYVSRADRALRFAPLKIPVTRLTQRKFYYEGMIGCGHSMFYSRSFIDPGETIMTVVSRQEDFGDVRWGMRRIGDPNHAMQSALVRKFALQSLSTVIAGASLRIVKAPDGPPELWDGDRPVDIPVSLAHHGPWVAWSYRLPDQGSYRLPGEDSCCLSANNSSYRKSAAN
jgi:phosphopantetheinyl transferase (holo-ACP synthase)